jgi:hypothetical protein
MIRMAPAAGLMFLSLITACSATARPRPAARTQGQESVWVCHGGRNAKWQRVASPAADAHRRHGDTVSATPQREGQACG